MGTATDRGEKSTIEKGFYQDLFLIKFFCINVSVLQNATLNRTIGQCYIKGWICTQLLEMSILHLCLASSSSFSSSSSFYSSSSANSLSLAYLSSVILTIEGTACNGGIQTIGQVHLDPLSIQFVGN